MDGEQQRRMIGKTMDKTIVRSPAAPQAIGPYSQAVSHKGFIYCSGQLPVEVTTGNIPDGIAGQTRMALQNLSEVLKSAGSDLSAVLKTTVFMVDLKDFDAMNRVYSEFFPNDPPARSTVQVAKLPKDALIEIESVAFSHNL